MQTSFTSLIKDNPRKRYPQSHFIPAAAIDAVSPEVTSAVAAVESRAIEIVQLCNAAGRPMRASEFLRRGLTAEQVKIALEYGEPKPWREIFAAAGIQHRSTVAA